MPGDLERLLMQILRPKASKGEQVGVLGLTVDSVSPMASDGVSTVYPPTNTWNGATSNWGETVWG